jgi:hypothetical protein
VHRTRRVHCHGDVETSEIHRAKIPFIDMPAHHGSAVSFGRRAEKDAGTGSLAVAGFKI